MTFRSQMSNFTVATKTRTSILVYYENVQIQEGIIETLITYLSSVQTAPAIPYNCKIHGQLKEQQGFLIRTDIRYSMRQKDAL